MEKQSIGNIGLRYGVFTAGALIIFFFIMLLTGWIYYYELRALNYIFLFTGVFLALKKFKKKNDQNFAYLNGLGVGIATSAVSLLIFSVFVVIYLLIDAEFMHSLQQFEYFGQYLNPYIAGVAIFFEGTFSGILTSFILMQYYKYSHLKEMEKPLP